MKTTTGTLVIGIAAICFLSGCTQVELGGDFDESIGHSDHAFEVLNAINPNALNPRGLDHSGLNPMDLVTNPLQPSTVSSSVMAAIQEPSAVGDLSRELLRYIVDCSLESTESFNFSRRDLNGVLVYESYRGNLGVARDWSNSPIGVADQEWVSACLYSRVNWYQVPVMISSRAAKAPLNHIEAEELATYSYAEGGFWGNLFLQDPMAFACNVPENAMHSRSLLRDCAVGHVNNDSTTSQCGMLQIMGDCVTHCSYVDPVDFYFNHCGISATAGGLNDSSRVITTFLP